MAHLLDRALLQKNPAWVLLQSHVVRLVEADLIVKGHLNIVI